MEVNDKFSPTFESTHVSSEAIKSAAMARSETRTKTCHAFCDGAHVDRVYHVISWRLRALPSVKGRAHIVHLKTLVHEAEVFHNSSLCSQWWQWFTEISKRNSAVTSFIIKENHFYMFIYMFYWCEATVLFICHGRYEKDVTTQA